MRVLALALLLGIPGQSLAAQSLADVARKETERRQVVKGSGKVYTNDDLTPVPAPPSQPPAAEPDKATPPAEPKAAAAAAQDKGTGVETPSTEKALDTASEVKDQKYWSQRMTDLRGQLERDQTYQSALQNRIDALTTDFVNRDDPAQRGQISGDRQKALAELDRLKKAIELDRQAIRDAEEEARRSGVPPGWLR